MLTATLQNAGHGALMKSHSLVKQDVQFLFK